MRLFSTRSTVPTCTPPAPITSICSLMRLIVVITSLLPVAEKVRRKPIGLGSIALLRETQRDDQRKHRATLGAIVGNSPPRLPPDRNGTGFRQPLQRRCARFSQ